MIGIAALDAHAGLVRGDDRRLMQRRYGFFATGAEEPLRTAEQVHQAALAEGEPKQVGKRRLQSLVGQLGVSPQSLSHINASRYARQLRSTVLMNKTG